MSFNKYGEEEMAHIITSSQDEYFISRDRVGCHVLREKSSDGKELFSKIKDDGNKNKNHERVVNAQLLYDIFR